MEKFSKLRLVFEQFPNPEKIVLLGDIFDFYYECPRYARDIYGPFIDLISTKARESVVFYVQGNHDFFPLELLRKAGLEVRAKEVIIPLKNKLIYFTHGDLLSFEGIFTRIFLSFKLWQLLMKLIPCNIIYSIAKRISHLSRKKSSSRPPFTKDVERRIERLCAKYDVVVTAHFHNPILRTTESGAIYANPGDWLQFYTFMTIEESEAIIWRFNDTLIVKEKEVKI